MRRDINALLTAAVLLSGCGGGGEAPPTGVTPTPPPSGPTFANVSVHDPSVIQVDGTYYVFGSHLAAANTTDLMNWTRIADGVTASNPLFDNVVTELADTFAWSQVTDLWAPDVVELADGRFHLYYDSCRGDSPRSALGVAVADGVAGPYVNEKILLRSGMWGQISEDGVNVYDPQIHPNVVDPQTFFDHDGALWMVYGSYSGGIFILAMDPATGFPKKGQGYGKHLLGGHHARIEAPYVLYNAHTGLYYLFTSFGGLDAVGGYDIRVTRSRWPDGPYFDAAGNDMSQVKGNPDVPFDDSRIAPYGQKLMGNYQFALSAGETGTRLGYVSPGHNSALYQTSTDQYFLIFHTRFPGRGEYHEVRVHELLFNQSGWPVVAALRYVPLSLSDTPQSAVVTSADAQGSYKYVDHGKDITATIRTSEALRLEADGTISGTVNGTWRQMGNNYVTMELTGGQSFDGVLSRQWNGNAGSFAVTFSAQSSRGVSIWGVRTGD